MLTDLKYLVATTSRKEFTEELSHIHIHAGRGYAFNGLMSASTNVDVGLTVRPHASSFIKAITACDDKEAIALHITDAGRLGIRSGKFKAFVQCLDPYKEGIDIPKPQGQIVEVTDELLASIKELAPFMSIDASRPWAQGLRLVGNSIYATNNIILVQRWHGANFPYEIVIPADFVKAVIKVNEKPTRAQVTDSSLSFWFSNDRWLRTQLVVDGWPTNLDKIFRESEYAKPLPDGFFPALEKLRPFMSERGQVYIFPDKLATSQTEGDGASVDIETGITALFHLEQLQLLQSVMHRIDLSSYPSPSPFFGNKLRGVIVGLRQ
jgi:hypothetical protein